MFDPRVREVLELLSFIGTVLLAVLGCLIFLQLKYARQSLKDARDNLKLAAESLRVAKNDLQIRVDREAIVLAAEKTEEFGKTTLPRAGDVLERVAAAGFEISEWELRNTSFDLTSLVRLEEANAWLRSLKETDLLYDLIQTLNEFESFSMFFAEGAANEQIAYPSVASVYCSYVRQFAPLMISLRQENSEIVSGPYRNIITLYERWSSRLRKAALDRESARIQAESSGLHITAIPVVGAQTSEKSTHPDGD